jgi:flagellar biosynthesis protein
MKKQSAIALRYEREKNSAPKVTAKGEGKQAQKIIAIAKEHQIPIQEDPDLIELLSKVELNQEVPAEMYQAVAEVFSFIYELSKK